MTQQCPRCHSVNPADSKYCRECATPLPSADQTLAYDSGTAEFLRDEFIPGSVFADRYQIMEELGSGGMGKVFKAFDSKIKEVVALKLLNPEVAAHEETIERFRNELKFARKIVHKNVGRMYDLNEAQGTHYILMEYVPGEDLKSFIIRSRQLAIGTAISIAMQIAEGLKEAHRLGVVHRDLKPQNVMIDKEGNVRIMDFGIARALEQRGTTEAGLIIGTPGYMSPEQAQGEDADQRSDIYSLGIIIYEMVTGKAAFEGKTTFDIIKKQLTETPPDPTEINPQVPADLSQLILKCLEKDREKRYQTAEDLLTELAAIGKAKPEGKRSGEKRWENSIAVLPFADLSPQRDQDYFCDGLAEELINSLSHVEALRVAARTSAFSFKGKNLDIREIGERLNVQAILEGSVRKAGERLRITAQLVNVADGYHLWSEKYDRGMDDIFAVQDEIALEIVDKLKVKLLKGEKTKVLKRYTENKDAYNLFLKGRYFWNRRNEGDLKRAIECYQQALEKDPNYSLPYLGIADHFLMAGLWHYLPPETARQRVKEALDKALEIDDQLGEAYTSLGYFQFLYEWDWPTAEINFKRGLALNPNNVWAHAWYGCFLHGMSRFENACRELKIALEMEPLSPIVNALAGIIISVTHIDEGKKQMDKAIEMEPNLALAHLWQGWIYMYLQIADERALGHLQVAVNLGLTFALGWLGCAYGRLGKKEEALKILSQLDELAKERYISPLQRSAVHMGLGMFDQAFEYLERAYSQREPYLALIVHPSGGHSVFSEEFRQDERYRALMGKMKKIDLS